MSSFVWIDHSEKQRRQVLEAIDLFREKDIRDQLGIAGIRDAISDAFFPGTGALQTRARYFFFIPWMLKEFEAKKPAQADISRKVKDFEIRLIDILALSTDKTGTIGIQGRKSLQRFPSSIYWNGLKILKVADTGGSMVDYYRTAYGTKSTKVRELVNDDGESVQGRTSIWHSQIPPRPVGFPENAEFAMTPEEGQFLKEQVLTHHTGSLFAFCLNQGVTDSDYVFAWDHPSTADADARLAKQIEMARTFSEVMHGAAILYNFALAQMEPRRDEYIESTQEMFVEWRELLDDRAAALRTFDAQEFWAFIKTCGHVPSIPTTAFVDAWFMIARNQARRIAIDTDKQAIGLVLGRERQIKGPLARCDNRRVREMWLGDAGLGRLVYRWPNAQVLLNDIAASEGVA